MHSDHAPSQLTFYDDSLSSSSLGGGCGLDEVRVFGDVDRQGNATAGDSEDVDGVIGGDSELITNRVVDNVVEEAADDGRGGGYDALYIVLNFGKIPTILLNSCEDSDGDEVMIGVGVDVRI
ncbi:hypothetical protein AKJ16_DCAP08715, partial [Drosera capensis]